jgi:DNA-binding MarR family transcriptional regulator
MRSESELAADFALLIFKLNGQMLTVGEQLARPVGLTVARWQVLGAVLHHPLTVAGIAREMGITRQAVQRIANLLVDDGLLATIPNPAHKRSPLHTATDAGLTAVRRIAPAQTAFATRLAEAYGTDNLRELVASLEDISSAVARI